LMIRIGHGMRRRRLAPKLRARRNMRASGRLYGPALLCAGDGGIRL